MEKLATKFCRFLQDHDFSVKQEGSFAFTDYEDLSIKIESIDEEKIFNWYIIDKKTDYAEYPREAIRYVFKRSFEYCSKCEFMFKNANEFSGVYDLHQGLLSCISEFKKLRDIFYANERKLQAMNLKPKFLRLKDFSKVFNKNFFYEVDSNFYKMHTGCSIDGDFIRFALFIKNINLESVNVELYKVNEGAYVYVIDFELESNDLKECLITSYEKIRDNTLNLITEI